MCIYCFKEIERRVSWSQFFYLNQGLCKTCLSQFIFLKHENSCKYCSKSKVQGLCQDCKRWRRLNSDLELNYSLIKYTEFVKQYLFDWKYGGDIVLFKGLIPLINPKKVIKKLELDNFKVIPIPVHSKREKERAFNQSSLIAGLFPYVDETRLVRVNNDKQSEKNKLERLNSENPFQVMKKGDESILLIDDIYTTGATLRHAAAKLKEAGYGRIVSFTLFRS